MEDRNCTQSGSGISMSIEVTSACADCTDSQVVRQLAHVSRWALCLTGGSRPSSRLAKSSGFRWPNIFPSSNAGLIAHFPTLAPNLAETRILYQLPQFFQR